MNHKIVKKTRNPNFTYQEKSKLLQCVLVEKEIVENKKTDRATWKDKESAWERIALSFNCDSSCYRSGDALKKCYANNKKEVRKEAAAEKLSVFQTGGGKPYKNKDPNFEIAVAVMNSKTVHGIENSFDSDCTEAFNMLDQQDWGSYTPDKLRQPVNPKLQRRNFSIEPEIPTTSESTTAITSTLTGPVPSTAPTVSTNPTASNTPTGATSPTTSTAPRNKPLLKVSEEKTWSSRRRPIISSLSTSKITENYTELSKIKMELAQLQLKTLKEEADLRRKSLELDIQIKNEILNKIKQDGYKITDNAFGVLKDLQNISKF